MLLQENSSTSCMAPQCYSTRWRLCTILLIVAAALVVCDARRSRKRRLIRARDSERIPNSYFVHIRQSVSLGELKELVRELTNRSSQEGPFKVSTSAIVTKAAYGFPVRLSDLALDYVSIEELPAECIHILFRECC